MQKYVVSNIQYYETTDETVTTYYHGGAAPSIDNNATGGIKVAAYAGVYDGTSWVDEVNGYTCTFDVASGEWTVEKS